MPTTSLKRLFWFWNGVNLLLLVLALAHRSTDPDILSRYTRLYALSLLPVLALVALVLVASLFWRERVSALLARIAPGWGIALALALFAATTALWLAPFDGLFIKLLVTVNAICLGMWMTVTPLEAVTPPERPDSPRVWQRILLGALALILIVALFSASSVPQEQSSGDEAAWTNMAVTWARTGQAYFQIGAWTPLSVSPGYGYWVVALAGWTQVFGISLASGRLLMWVVYALAVITVTAAGWRLYDRWVGLFAGLVVAGSVNVLASRIVRPELALAIVGAVLLLIYLRPRPVWALAAGLIAALGLEIHASCVAYIIGAGALYATDLLLKRADPQRFLRLGLFVVGAGIGGAVYTWLNILSLPEPGYFFEALRSQRGFLSGFNLGWLAIGGSIYWARAPLEMIGIALGIIGVALRRGSADRLLLRFLFFVAVGYVLFVPSGDRYLILFAPFAYLGIASTLRFGLASFGGERRLAGGALAVLCLCSAALAQMIPAVQPNVLAAAPAPEHVRHVQALTDASAVVAGDVSDYWWFTGYPSFYNNGAEYDHVYEIRQGDTGLWARIDPDVVFFTAYPGNPQIAPLLKQWVDDKHYTLVETVESGGLTTLIWQRPGYNPPTASG